MYVIYILDVNSVTLMSFCVSADEEESELYLSTVTKLGSS